MVIIDNIDILDKLYIKDSIDIIYDIFLYYKYIQVYRLSHYTNLLVIFNPTSAPYAVLPSWSQWPFAIMAQNGHNMGIF